jgi:hypothetical protein
MQYKCSLLSSGSKQHFISMSFSSRLVVFRPIWLPKWSTLAWLFCSPGPSRYCQSRYGYCRMLASLTNTGSHSVTPCRVAEIYPLFRGIYSLNRPDMTSHQRRSDVTRKSELTNYWNQPTSIIVPHRKHTAPALSRKLVNAL